MNRTLKLMSATLAFLAFAFAAPAPAGSGDFDHVDVATLSGGSLNGTTPKGKAQLRTRGNTITLQSFRKLTVEAQDVNLPDGTSLNISAANTQTGASVALGTMRVALGRAKLEIDERDGGVLAPFAPNRSAIEVSLNGTVILSGAF